MRDFDAERLAVAEKDRSFRIGGRDFTYQTGVRPEVLARYFDGSPTGDNIETLAIYDDTVIAFLSPGQEEAWREIRAVEGPAAITLRNIRDLLDWLIAEQTGRPTQPPSESSNGSGSQANGTGSTADSGSPVGTGSAA